MLATERSYRLSVTIGNRSCSEVVDVQQEKEDYYESGWVNDPPTWEQWMRPIKIHANDLESLNGNHILYGWVESLFQANGNPYLFLTEGNAKIDDWYYEFE